MKDELDREDWVAHGEQDSRDQQTDAIISVSLHNKHESDSLGP